MTPTWSLGVEGRFSDYDTQSIAFAGGGGGLFPQTIASHPTDTSVLVRLNFRK